MYGELIIKKDNLVVPHPHMGKRQFVLIPLQELEPDVRDPVSGGKYEEILKTLDDQGVYTFSVWDYT